MRLRAIVFLALLSIWLALPAIAQAASPGYTKIGTATGTTFSDPSCPNQSSCYYQVTAIDSGGFESGPASCAATSLCVGGNQVVAVMPSSGTHTVGLAWTASATTAVSYNIYRHIGPLPPASVSIVVQ